MGDASNPSFTPAQLRALAWLPSNGYWREFDEESDREENAKELFDELYMFDDRCEGDVPMTETRDWETSGCFFRLTPSGVRLKAELIANGKLEQ